MTRKEELAANPSLQDELRIMGVLLVVIACLVSCSRPASQWSDPGMWYEPLSAYDPDNVDVLYIASTDVLSAVDENGDVSWQTLLTDEDKAAIRGEIEWVESNMFSDGFNLSSPYYHQFTFDAISGLDSDEFDEVFGKVSEEVCEAFDYYMAHENNGREFIIAGFSQGAMLCLDLLRHMSDEEYSRMIACYSLGYRLSAEDLRHPHIKAATGAGDRGVVVSFNSTLTREAIWPFVSDGAAACINPVNWQTDTTQATFYFNGTCSTVSIDPETQVLLVQPEDTGFVSDFYELAPFFLDAGVSRDNLHHWDLLFYPSLIHDNALLRAGAHSAN